MSILKTAIAGTVIITTSGTAYLTRDRWLGSSNSDPTSQPTTEVSGNTEASSETRNNPASNTGSTTPTDQEKQK